MLHPPTHYSWLDEYMQALRLRLHALDSAQLSQGMLAFADLKVSLLKSGCKLGAWPLHPALRAMFPP